MSTSYTILTGAKTVDGSIKQWVNDTLVPSATILSEAQEWIYRRLRVREMLTATTGTLATAADTIALPTGYVATKLLMFTEQHKAELRARDPKDVTLAFEWDNASRVREKPRWFYADGSNLQLDAPADQSYPWRHLYYRALDDLSSGSPTNFLTTKAQRLLRCACVALAVEWKVKGTEEKAYWMNLAMTEIAELNRESDFAAQDIDMMVIPE